MSTLDDSSIDHGSRSWKCSHGSCRSGISSGSMRPTDSTATCRSSPVSRLTSFTVEPYGVRYRSICSVNASRSPRSQAPCSTGDNIVGGAMHSATDRYSNHSSSCAITRRPRMPNAPSTSSNCSTVRARRRRSASATPRPNSRRARSAIVSPRVRRANVMPRYVWPSAWLTDSRCCWAATRWSDHDGAPSTVGSGYGVLPSTTRAHWSAGNGRVVRRRCSRNPARPAYCSEIADSSASRSGSGRNAQRTSGSQYHAVTVFGVNVRCPAISVIASSTAESRSFWRGLRVFSRGVFRPDLRSGFAGAIADRAGAFASAGRAGGEAAAEDSGAACRPLPSTGSAVRGATTPVPEDGRAAGGAGRDVTDCRGAPGGAAGRAGPGPWPLPLPLGRAGSPTRAAPGALPTRFRNGESMSASVRTIGWAPLWKTAMRCSSATARRPPS